MQKITVGILGLGTVGVALVNVIDKSRDKLISKYGIEIVIKKIFVRNLNKKRNVNLAGIQLTNNPNDIINDKDIDIVCECIGGGGTDLTVSYLIDAMRNGKHIVLSSKKVLSLFSDLIFKTSKETKSIVKYDATVGGGIPTQRVINSCLFGEQIDRVFGIVNATSNFIYSKMMVNNTSFMDALLDAQKMGYAENDPSEDILGNDALYKLSILILMYMNKIVDVKKMQAIPIVDTNLDDMIYAEELGYSIKPIIYGELCDDIIKYAVGPSLIKKENIISGVTLNNNIICVNGSLSGNLCFYGQGAGGSPTASAMFDDLINIILFCKRDYFMPQYAFTQKKEMKRYIRMGGYTNEIQKCIDLYLKKDVTVSKFIDNGSIENYKELIILTDNLSDEKINNYIEKLQENNIKIISAFYILDNYIN